MGRDTVQFEPGDLVVEECIYGSVTLRACNAPAARALDAVAAAVGFGSDRTRVVSLVIECNDEAPKLEVRHAGREGTPERGVLAERIGRADEGGAPSEAAGR